MTYPNIEGLNNLPTRPTLVYVNRADVRVVQALEQVFQGRVAWLVERSCMPGSTVMSYLQSQRAEGILGDLHTISRELLADRIHDKFKKGLHVILLTGRPTQARGALADIPTRLLGFLDDTALPVLPVYAAYHQNHVENALSATPAENATLSLRIMPQQRAGKALGARARMAWMEAAADHLADHPLLQDASLPRLLVTALMRHQDARLIDGVDDSSLTFRNLLALALMLAGFLRKQTKDRRLGIILPPGKLSAIANLACLLAGISAVNINYTQDKAAAERDIRQAGVNRFLSEERFRRKMSSFAWPSSRDLIFIDRELTAMGRAPFTFWRTLVRFGKPAAILRRLHLPATTPDAEAALLFTAGTEGATHAVPLSHRMLTASLLQLQNRLEMQPGQRLLSALPAYTPLGLVHGLLLPLLFGYDLVTYPSPRAAQRLATLMVENRVRLAPVSADMVRTMLAIFAEENRKQLAKRAPALAEAQSCGRLPELFAHLRYWIAPGSDVTEPMVQRVQELFGVPLLTAYSMTEAAPLASLNLPPYEGGHSEGEGGTQLPTIPSHRRGSAGCPLPGIAVRITDVAHEGRLLPPGAPGLIWLKGANMASRYLDEEEGLLRGLWYCTGDVGYVDEEGMLFIAGRRMRFSCIGGELVPHEKLESVLAQVFNLSLQPGKPQIAIVAVPDPKEGEQLVLLSTVHRANTDYRYTTMRYTLMNMGYPEQWTPRRLVVAHTFKFLPTLPSGKLNYPFCFAGVCSQLKIALPGQEE